MTRLLVVDDDHDLRDAMLPLLAEHFETTWESSALGAFTRLATQDFDVVLTDLRMQGMSGLELCDRIAISHPELPVVVMTAHSSVDAAVAALRARANDFVLKPFANVESVVAVLARAAQERRPQHLASGVQAMPLNRTVAPSSAGMIGESAPMRHLDDLIDRVKSLEATVLITGESGTGKELVARAIHMGGARRARPFVVLNCAAVPDTMLEHELFGHAKGAFTDARTDHVGLFQQADGGTLFLDELGELPIQLQPKLLRALQERVVRPIGSSREYAFDVRIITATNRDLLGLVHEGRFRKDLYYRVNVIDVPVPPLRERGDDVLLCTHYFVMRFAEAHGKTVHGITPEVAGRLLAHSWPGNVRELQNTIERAVALTRSAYLVVDDLPEALRSLRPRPKKDGEELISLEEVERRHISRVMAATGGNKTAAAEILGVDRRTLLRKEVRPGPLPPTMRKAKPG